MSEVGPVLSAMPEGARPDTVCAICPKAMWFRSRKQGVRAFCRELRHITWQQGEQDPVTECDGQAASDSS
ncbi:hypothetical protein [uncultured Sphingomonas sp.]|uniref:hypothetical protein n=1 Tax=uncultured Sphingomonas sp. TaxID=158754 RepID=UPI00374A6F36